MIYFDSNITHTLVDIPTNISMLIHTIAGCNLHCYKCHNYDSIVNFNGTKINQYELLDKIKLIGNFYDNIIFSGGEMMMNKPADIIQLFTDIKKIYNGKLIIYTNGFYYNNIKKVYDAHIVDDWYMDIKFPYNMDVTETDKHLFKEILGIEYDIKLVSNVMKSIELLRAYNFRTVKYPQYNERLYTNLIQLIYTYNLKHQFNEFFEIN